MDACNNATRGLDVKSWVRKCAFGALVIFLLLPVVPSRISPKEPSTRVVAQLSGILGDETYLRERGYLEDGEIRVLVEYDSPPARHFLEARALDLEGRVLARFERNRLLSLKISYDRLPELQAAGITIHLDRQFHACLDQSVPIVKPSASWSQVEAFFGYEINGSGVKVAVLDTGIETAHSDLDDLDDNITTTDPKVILEHSFVVGNPNPDDDSTDGHGTHIAGIIGGTGFDSGGARAGVAPGCYILNGKVLNSAGVGFESWILAGIQWALGNDSDVINLSLSTAESGNGTDPLSRAVENAWSQGVPVILAAGRSGAGPYKIGQPGVARKGITVGASDGNALASLSPSGPTYDFRLKPDLLAPGIGIWSCDDDASGYATMGGTSQAAAHVAGAVALLLQAHPTWTPDEVKGALLTNAVNLGLSPYEQGSGRLYLPSAVNATVLVDPIIDFALFRGDALNSQLITLENARPYSVDLFHVSSKYNLSIPSPYTVTASQVIVINVSIQPSAFLDRRLWEYVNFTVEGKTIHVIATGINPNLTLTAPASILYNTTLTANLSVLLDVHPVDFLNDSYIRVTANGTLLVDYPITGNGTFSCDLTNATLYRGTYLLSTDLYINHSRYETSSTSLQVLGYGSSIHVPDRSCARGSRVSFTVNEYENVSGTLYLYAFLEGAWVLVDTTLVGDDFFQFDADWGRGHYSMKVVFPGDATHEPATATFDLHVRPDFTLLLILLLPLALVALGVILLYRRHRRKGRQAKKLVAAIEDRDKIIRGVQRGLRAMKVPTEATREPGVDVDRDSLNEHMSALVREAQVLLKGDQLEAASAKYRAASELATQLGKEDMAEVYLRRSREIQAESKKE